MATESKHTLQELYQMQFLPLSSKILMTRQRIKWWVDEFGEDGVYVSFSGGKDSTVLLDIARQDYPNIEAVFVDTGLEYPEIRQFVKTFDNVTWLKPEKNFKQVISEYGYPFISKQVSKRLHEWRNAIQKGKDIKQTEAYKEFTGTRYYQKDGKTYKSFHNKQKWMFMTEAPFKFSNKCCDVMKKQAFKTIKHKKPITAQMAQESINRQKGWLLHGCNAYDAVTPISNPMSFWTEQDVLLYIYSRNLPICSVYGDIVKETEIDGQLSIVDLYGKDAWDFGTPILKTTGCKRTGCMFCGFGCHLEKPGEGRFERIKVTHPKQYEYIMKPVSQGGLGYKEVIDWLNKNGNLDIRY